MRNFVIVICASVLLSGCAGSSENSPNYFGNGYEAAKAGNYVVAERELGTVLADNPNDPYAALAMGYVMQQTGRSAEARAMYETAIREGGDVYPTRHYVLADREYGTRPVEEDSIAELARRNLASL